MIIGTINNPIDILIFKDLVRSNSTIFDIYLYNDFTQKETLIPHTLICLDRQYLINVDLTGYILGDYEFRVKDLGVIVYKEKMKII